LSADALQPWRHRSWIFPRDPPFAEQAGRILDLYANIPAKVGRLDAMGRRSRGPRLREIRGQPEVPQDPLHRVGVFNQREEPQPPAAAGALKHIDPKRPSHQIGPEIGTGSTW